MKFERTSVFVASTFELVRNAVRHAAPTSIAISMRSSPTELGATVVDDGRGIPVDVLERSEGGLANLRHRTAQRGGALVVSASGGTRIDVTFAT
jgi:two-component system sensor histidine kinase UhpB